MRSDTASWIGIATSPSVMINSLLVEGYHIDLEAEANYAAGRLLFLQDHFHEHVKGVQHTLKSLNKVADDFKNSWTSTLYRTVEVLDVPRIRDHREAILSGGNSEEKTRHFITSAPFEVLFPSFDEGEALKVVRTYCKYSTRGPLGRMHVCSRADGTGERWEFTIESFALPHGDVLTLAILLRKLPLQIGVIGQAEANLRPLN